MNLAKNLSFYKSCARMTYSTKLSIAVVNQDHLHGNLVLKLDRMINFQFYRYKEKALKNTKLGGMLILILLRSILQNKNDTIFQKTCMNILVDMSGTCVSFSLIGY